MAPSDVSDGRASLAKLIYSAITSLDLRVANAAGRSERTEPDQEVRSFANKFERDVGTELLGYKTYDTVPSREDFSESPADSRGSASAGEDANTL